MAQDEEKSPIDSYAPVIARSLGYLCLGAAELKDAPLAHAVAFLERLGFTRPDCAKILDTTTESIRVTLATAARKKPSKTTRKG